MLPVPGPFSPAAKAPTTNPETPTTKNKGLKRKMDMLTDELSRNRLKLAKKSRADNVSRGQMVIEVPDFPIEFYRVAELAWISTAPLTSLQKWFENFPKNPSVQRQPPAYHDWIQTRAAGLLPKVLNVIGNYLGKGKVTKDEFLSCRLVSKSWKQSIDQFLQGAVRLEPTICPESKLINVVTSIYSSDYQSLLEMLCSLERNKDSGILTPFPSGSLEINIYSRLEDQYQLGLNNALEILLEFHGKSVQSFKYRDYSGTDISSMAKWLKKMPNLKALEIFLPSSYKRDDYIIPDILHLPKLVTFVGTSIPPKLIEQVLSVNPQIRHLSVGSLQQPEWSNLEQLCLTSLSNEVTSVTHLQSLAVFQLPLEKLRLRNDNIIDYDSDGLDLGEVFQFLCRYQDILKELHLNLKDTDNHNNLSLRLPHLQRLSRRLGILDNWRSYDFLLPLESLEVLEIYLVPGEELGRESDDSQVIQLIGYFDRLYESNVWDLFPRLKRVKVKIMEIDEFEEDEEEFYTVFTYTRDKLGGTFNHFRLSG